MEYTKFSDVYNKFLTKIEDYSLASTNIEDFEHILENYLSESMAIGYTVVLEDRLSNVNFEEKHFGVKLDNTEQWMIAVAMVQSWLDRHIYRQDLFETAIVDRDYQEMSHANQIRALSHIKDELRLELHELEVAYSYRGFQGLS